MYNRQFLISPENGGKYLQFFSEYYNPDNNEPIENETNIDFYVFEFKDGNFPFRYAFHCDENVVKQKLESIFKNDLDIDFIEETAFDQIKQNLASPASKNLYDSIIDFALVVNDEFYEEIQKQVDGFGIIVIFNADDRNKCIETIVPKTVNISVYRIK